jgi:uncharacterized protein YcnI
LAQPSPKPDTPSKGGNSADEYGDESMSEGDQLKDTPIKKEIESTSKQQSSNGEVDVSEIQDCIEVSPQKSAI